MLASVSDFCLSDGCVSDGCVKCSCVRCVVSDRNVESWCEIGVRYVNQIRCVRSRCQMCGVRLVGHVDESDRCVRQLCQMVVSHRGVR